MRRGQTSNQEQIDAMRRDAIGGRRTSKKEISRDRSANESSVYPLHFFIIFLFERTHVRVTMHYCM
jgi:hypothetical protein